MRATVVKYLVSLFIQILILWITSFIYLFLICIEEFLVDNSSHHVSVARFSPKVMIYKAPHFNNESKLIDGIDMAMGLYINQEYYI